MKNKFSELLYAVLMGTEGVLGFADSRIRDAFLKVLKEKTVEYQEARNKLLTTLGKPIPEKEGFYSYTPEYLKELEILNEEIMTLPEQPKIKEYVTLSSYRPKVGESEMLDEALASLEPKPAPETAAPAEEKKA